MRSFKANGREQASRERRNAKFARRRGLPKLEWLEERLLLSEVWHPTSTNLADVENGPMANLGGPLISLYEAFQGDVTSSAALAKQFPLEQFNGDLVLLGLNASTDFQGFKTSLVNLGMQIVDTNPTDGLVDGYLPINELPTAAELPQTLSGHPHLKSVTYSGTIGAAINEADYSTFANEVTSANGSGVTVGVISNSFNDLGGYATDVKTGDLPPNVNVLPGQGGPAGQDDEGRAMAQNIYHMAPGAGLAFATADPTDQIFAQNIKALANTAGAKVIVDDIGSSTDPFFQPGLITQAINTVTSQGVTYLSAAGNEANHGYLSTFRGVTGTVAGMTGTFMNFNPSGTSLLLPITVNVANTSIDFQFDQPWASQEPMGSPGPTSQVNFYVVDANGNLVTGVTGGTDNNVALHEPQQFVTIPSTGNYFVAMRLVSGPNPGHVEFLQFGQQSTNDLIVSQQFGTAGGTSYPTSFGHNAAANTIGVGAVPWWSPTPFLGQNPLASEPFSSSGPSIQVMDANGTPLSSPLTVQNPTVTAPDGGNTTFFGFVAATNNPPIQGQPATSTNLYASFTPDQSNLPSFFGTSSAAPNTAAIAALMLQTVPSATPAQIKAALIESAATNPMNGATAGTWNAQGGYGLINAISALNAVNVLQVTATSPANGTTVTVTPSAITVTFSKPVQFSTVSSSDIQFTSMPPGVSVVLGTPQTVDNATDPTIVAFPYSFSDKNPPPATANGNYTFIVTGPIISEDGKKLVPSSPITFTLEDTTPPEVASTSLFSRVVTIQFTKAMNPSTITLANLYVERQGGTGNWLNPINLNALGVAVNLTYNPLTNTATLDYSALPQTDMPTDDYAIVVNTGPTGVTDLVGNELDGAFSGSFPSGNGKPGTQDFFEDLGTQVLQAPVLTAFQMTTDTGIAGDQNTKDTQPVFIGQVYSPFPGTVAGLNVSVQFNSLPPGEVEQEVTNASGGFTVAAPTLPEGLQSVGIMVVNDGLTSSQQYTFRIDTTAPQVIGSSLAKGANINQLQSLSLNVVDDSNPATGPLATPSIDVFPAIDPASASNVSNYSLTLRNPDGTQTDESQFITSATFVARPPQTSNGFTTAYTGTINLTFGTGLPAGNYTFTVHTAGGLIPGLVDAAGNPIQQNFTSTFTIQSQPVFITNLQMQNSASATIGGPRSYYELPSTVPGYQAARSHCATDPVGDRPLQPDPLRQCRLQQQGAVDRLGQHLPRHRRRQLRRPGRRRAGQHPSRFGLQHRARNDRHAPVPGVQRQLGQCRRNPSGNPAFDEPGFRYNFAGGLLPALPPERA